MALSIAQQPPRSTAFGTRTRFRARRGSLVTTVILTLLRALKNEEDARRLGSLHCAYWVPLSRRTLARLQRPKTRLPRDFYGELLFISDFSGDWEVYLAGFHVALKSVLDVAWGTAEGWESVMSLGTYLDYIRGHEIKPKTYIQTYGQQASADSVRKALGVSHALDQLLSSHRSRHDDVTFQTEYAELLDQLASQL